MIIASYHSKNNLQKTVPCIGGQVLLNKEIITSSFACSCSRNNCQPAITNLGVCSSRTHAFHGTEVSGSVEIATSYVQKPRAKCTDSTPIEFDGDNCNINKIESYVGSGGRCAMGCNNCGRS